MQADLFCRVIDNYGDIGVAWRLARQLSREHGWEIRLWVDDLYSFKKLEPRISLGIEAANNLEIAKDFTPGIPVQQRIDDIEIVHWTARTALKPYPVALAMFSCELPQTYMQDMHSQPVLWINLEYLSAEKWVEDCHALPSLRSDGLSSYFFFPGFTNQTGGLLREADLLARRDAWLSAPAAQLAFLKKTGVSAEALQAWTAPSTSQDKARLISLFCYPNAPVQDLIDQLAAEKTTSILLLPEGIAPARQTEQQANVFLERIPFLPQPDYDKLLWTCDLNFVRGEDSIVRGLWAGKPLLWQIYSQTENTHLIKLDAWLELSGLPENVKRLIRSWNPESSELLAKPGYSAANEKNTAFRSLLSESLSLASFKKWQLQSRELTKAQACLTDLATSLNRFIQDKLAA